MRPIERTAVQMHHRYDVQHIGAHKVNDGVRELVEVELAILSPNFAPTLGLGRDAAQCTFKLVKKVISQTGLPLLVPQRSGV